MFSKPFHVKTCSNMKSSERKKLVARLLNEFVWTTEDVERLLPNKSEMTMAKIRLQTDGIIVFVYCCQKIPYFFEIEHKSKLYPTVYALWKYPNLVAKVFTTWPPVVPKISGGADLMLPGVILNTREITLNSYGKFEKGTICTINTIENKAPFAVGETALSSEDMYMSAKKGKCVIVFHTYMDQLWEFGDKSRVVDLGPPFGFNESTEADKPDSVDESLDTEITVLVDNIEKLDLEQEAGSNLPEDDDAECVSEDNLVDLADDEFQNVEAPETSMSHDELFIYTFKKTLKLNGKKLELPLLTSTFYRKYVQPNCPCDHTMDLKKTSFKKLSKFLQLMQTEGFIQIKELTKGVESIVGVNLAHEQLKGFSIQEETSVTETKEVDHDAYVAPKVEEVYFVTAKVLPLFKQFNCNKGSYLSVAEVRDIIKEYVSAKSLKDAENPSVIKMDSVLSSIVANGEVNRQIKWNEALDLCLNQMKSGTKIEFEGREPKLLKEKLKPIEISIEKRTANKTVTLINNLEIYGINMKDLANLIQRRVATSTTVQPNPARKDASQILIQGNQVHHLSKIFLDEFKLPKRYIKGLELAKKPKK